MAQIVHDGRSYRLGEGAATPLELTVSGIGPAISPAGWQEIPDPFQVGRDYCRTYRSQTGLRVILTASIEGDRKRWLHVSVSHRGGRLPTWREMCDVKDVFCGLDATAYQVHPPRSKHVSIHQACLHLWCMLDGPVTPDFTRGGESI